MATRTRNLKQPAKPRTATKPRRAGKTRVARSSNSSQVMGFLVPLFFILCILFCIGFLGFMGYRTVAASAFFEVKTIDVRGAKYAAREEMEKIVRNHSERNGVWNASLESIRSDIEKMVYVKSVAVSRILPNGIQVRVDERIPKAIVRLNAGDFWVDDEAVVLSAAGKSEQGSTAILKGWDESKSERATKDNRERVKLYRKMLSEWQELGIANRVSVISLSDLQDPQAIVQDSGSNVAIFLGKEDFGKRLQKALEVITGKGEKIESLISHGANVVAKYRNS